MPRTRRPILWISLFLALTCLAPITLAQSGTRAAPSNDNIFSSRTVTFSYEAGNPTLFSVTSFAEATLETGEIDPTCSTENSFGSVWYRFNTVPGQLVIDTAGSTGGTVMALYPLVILPKVDYLTEETACVETGPFGSEQARLDMQVGTGAYLLVVVNNDQDKPDPATLNISFSLTPDQLGGVSGDNFAAAKPLKLAKRFTINEVQRATVESGEVEPSCAYQPIMHSVWNTFDNPFDSEFSANTAGSALITSLSGGAGGETVLALYRESTPGTLTEVACALTPSVGYAELVDVDITPGTYYIQLATSSIYNVLPGSRYMLAAGLEVTSNALQSGDFEGDNSRWKIGGTGGGSIADTDNTTNLTTTTLVCPGGGKTTLTQKINFGALRFKKELQFVVGYKAASEVQDHYEFIFDLTAKTASGSTMKQRSTLRVRVGSLASGGVAIPFKPGNYVSLKIKITCAPPAGQTLLMDDLTLRIFNLTPLRTEAAPLPLPEF